MAVEVQVSVLSARRKKSLYMQCFVICSHPLQLPRRMRSQSNGFGAMGIKESKSQLGANKNGPAHATMVTPILRRQKEDTMDCFSGGETPSNAPNRMQGLCFALTFELGRITRTSHIYIYI